MPKLRHSDETILEIRRLLDEGIERIDIAKAVGCSASFVDRVRWGKRGTVAEMLGSGELTERQLARYNGLGKCRGCNRDYVQLTQAGTLCIVCAAKLAGADNREEEYHELKHELVGGHADRFAEIHGPAAPLMDEQEKSTAVLEPIRNQEWFMRPLDWWYGAAAI